MPDTPLLDRDQVITQNDKYTPDLGTGALPNIPFQHLDSALDNVGNLTTDGQGKLDYLGDLNNKVSAASSSKADGKLLGGSPLLPLNDLKSDRYDYVLPGRDNEDIYSQGQSNWAKAANGLLKGTELAGTTFLNGTAGLLYGIGAAVGNANFSSLYNNSFSRTMDDWNKATENAIPNYYSAKERDSDWYQPDNWLKANFFWDKVVKNLGFAVGAYFSGGALNKALKLVPGIAALSKAGYGVQAADELEAGLNAVPQAERLATAENTIKGISDKVNNLYHFNPLNQSDRFLVSTLSTFGEAGMESLSNMNQYRDGLVDEYKKANNGDAPIGGAMDAINKEAEKVGNSSWWLNVMLLTGTNYVQLGKILGASYRGERSVFNNIVKDEMNPITRDAETGLFRSALPERGFKKLLYKAKNIGSLAFSPNEAFEEGSQYAIQTGTQDYFSKKRKGEDYSFLDSLYEGYRSAFTTKEGMENIIIGGLSGSIMEAGLLGFDEKGKFGPLKGGNLGERGVTGYGGSRAAKTQEAVDNLNKYSISKFSKDGVDASRRAVTLQEEQDAAVRQGDILEKKDLEFDYAHNYLSYRIKYGRFDLVQQDIDNLRNLGSTKEGMDQLVKEGKASETDTQTSFLARLSNFEEHAKNVNSLYQSANIRFSGLVNKETQERVYPDDVIDKMVYAASKVADYEKRLPQVITPLNDNGISIQASLDQAVKTGNIDGQEVAQAMQTIDALPVIDSVKDELKENLRDALEISLRRKQFLDEYSDMKNNPNKYKDAEDKTQATPLAAQPATIKIKSLDGDEELEVGRDYYLGNVELDSKEGGNKAKFIAFPQFKILGENQDGTIKIQAVDGSIRDVSKASFENHKIGSVADTQNNKKADFYRKNANTIFEFNFGDGKKQRGRLQYSPKEGILNFIYKAANGKTRTIEVTGDQFVAKKGFAQPMIRAVGQLTRAQQQSIEDMAAQQDERVNAKRLARLSIIEDLVDETNQRIGKVEDQLKDKRAQLVKITEDLEKVSKDIQSGDLTKKKTFKRATAAAIQSANRLSTLKSQLQDEIQSLQSQKDELDFNLGYFYDLGQNVDELPSDSKEFLDELKEQTSNLENLVLSTGDQINSISKLINNVENALESAVKFVRDLLSKFDAKYPGLPISPEGLRNFLNKDLEFKGVYPEYQTYLQANPNLFSDLRLMEEQFSQLEDLDIKPNERSVKELRTKLDDLQRELRDYEKELGAKQAILDKFEEAAKEYKKQQAELVKLKQSSAFLTKVFGSPKEAGSTITQSTEDDQKLQATNDGWNKWKSVTQIASTTAPSGENDYDAQLEYHKRHNTFLNNFDNLPNRDDIRVVMVTQANEEILGVKGLVSKSLEGFPEDRKDVKNTIVSLYVNSKGEPIGIGGKILETKDFNQLIFSTMSSSAIKDSKNNIRYREKEQGQEGLTKIEKWAEWYKELRTKWLGSNEPQSYQFNISTGIPNKGEASNNPVTSNLVSREDLAIPGLIQISQNGTLNINGVAKRYPIGRPVLIKGNTAAFLNNRNFTDKEAQTIFDSFKNLSETIAGEKWNPEVVKYLRGIMFIGEPAVGKAPGRNQFWIQGGQLNIGNQGFKIDFAPSTLDENKSKLLEIIKGAYFNVNNNTLSKGETFNEITGFKNAQPTTRTWKSYQHFLLSDKYELDPTLDSDGENGKSRGDVPLTTNLIIPQPGENNAPFKQRYSTIMPKEDENYQEPIGNTKPAEATVPVPEKKAEGGYILDGKTENVFTAKAGEKITFSGTNSKELSINHDKEYVKVIARLVANEASINAVRAQGIEGKPEEIADMILRQTLKNAIDAQQVAPEVKTEPKIEEPKGTSVEELIKRARAQGGSPDDARATRLVDNLQVQRMTNEDWNQFKGWAKKNIPQVPMSRINHIIDMVNGGKAWGVFDSGTIKVYEAAEKGTEYHEAFEAVWGMFVPNGEQASIYNEFRGRKGTFIERGTGRTIEFKDASLFQAKEALADEFADYINDTKEPKAGSVRRFFADLWNFLKGLFDNKGSIRDLFRKINAGNFANSVPVRDSITAQYAPIRGTDEQLTRELMEDISANIMFTLIPDNKTSAYYNFAENVNSKDLYTKVKELTLRNIDNTILGLADLYEKSTGSEKSAIGNAIENIGKTKQIIEDQWNEIVAKNKDFLRSVFKLKVTDQITVDEQENQNRNDYVKNDFFLNTKQNSATAIKLLFNTLVEASRTETIGKAGIPAIEPNSYGGAKLLKSGRSFIQVMNALSNTNTLKEMMNKIYKLAQTNPDYVRLYTRLKGNLSEPGELNYNNLTFNDWRLLFDFNNTFSKQAPSPYIIFTNEAGETYFQKADLNSLINNQVNQWVSSLRSIAKKGNEYIKKGKIGRLTTFNIKVPHEVTFSGDIKDIMRTKLIPMLGKLGVTIDPAILPKLSNSDLSSLKTASENYLKYINIKDATRIEKNKIGVTGPLSQIAEIVLRNSDLELKATYFNVENEQQQLYINQNYFSKFVNSINTIGSLEELRSNFPEYNDVFATNSVILRAGGDYFNTDGKRTGKELQIGYLNGLQLPKRNKTVDKFTESERMLSSINGILKGWYNIIMPSDSATEWMLNLGSFFKFSDFSSDAATRKIRSIFGGYLKDEMSLILAQPEWENNLYRDRNPNTLRFFNGILSEAMRAKVMIFLKTKPNIAQISDFVEKNIDAVEGSMNSFISDEVNNIKKVLIKEGKISRKIQETTKDGVVEKLIVKGFDTDFSRSNGFVNLQETNNGEIVTSEFTPEELDRVLSNIVANYAVANTEIHKLILGDPHAFKSYKDELKRVKSFGSPRGTIYSGEKANKWLNENMNKVGNLQLTPEDPGYTNFDDTVSTYTLSDFNVVGSPAILDDNNEYDEVDRSDAQMWAMPSFYREVLMKSNGSAWSEAAEALYQYDAAAFRQYYANRNKDYQYDKKLRAHDEKLTEKGLPEEFKANILKPIITGHKSDREYIDTMLDKQSAFPLFFSFTEEGSHLREHMIQNFENKMDYSIVLTGRKVGAQALHNFYSPEGKINTEAISDASKFQLPITNFGIQQETGYKGDKGSVRGTQATKLISINRFNAGVPNDVSMSWEQWSALSEAKKLQDSPVYKEIKHNDDILDALTNHGYEQLLKKLAVHDTGLNFIVNDPKKLEETLLEEVMRRESNDNIIDSVRVNKETGDFNISFEASNNYQTIKNILLAIVDKSVVSPKINGGPKIQLSSAMWDTDKTLQPYIKREKKWEKVEDFDKLSAKDKEKVRLFSDRLKFYRREEEKIKEGNIRLYRGETSSSEDAPLPDWIKEDPDFKNRPKGTFFSQTLEEAKYYDEKFGTNSGRITYIDIPHEDLEKYRASNNEGEKFSAKGMAEVEFFVPDSIASKRKSAGKRILPAQILLPHWFADKIRTTKRFGNDQEILDHLNSSKEGREILRGIGFRIPTQEMNSIEAFEVADFLPQAAGDTVVVPSEITKKAGSDFDVDKLNTYLKNIYISADGSIKLIPFYGFGEDAKEKLKDKVLASRILSTKDVRADANAIENLSDADLEDKDELREDLETIYKQSLQNEYIASFERLLLTPENYDRLIKPNSNNGMEKLRDELNEKLGPGELSGEDSKSPLLSLAYINAQRHNSILGKYSVGIGAISQTHHALSQRAPIYIDPERIEKASFQDKKFLGDGKILLNHNEVEVGSKKFPTISKMLDTTGQYISDKISAYMNGFVDISKDTFIVELGATPQMAGTFLFLERIGVPTKTVVYFMNQPIIREYIKMLTRNETTWLYNTSNIEAMESIFGAGDEKATKINEKGLGGNIEKYYKQGKDLTKYENAEQQLILQEFLKYAKMADHLRQYTQAVTWDTSNLNDFTLLAIKNLAYKNVKESNIFTSPDTILEKTFLGNMKNRIQQSAEAMSAFMKLQSPRVQNVIMKVLEPLIDPKNNYLSAKDAISVGNKVTSSFIDYLVQTRFTAYQSTLNSQIDRLLIAPGENTADRLRAIKADPSNPLNKNYALQRFGYLMGNQEGEVNNVVNQMKDNDPFSQNQFISSLRELKIADKDIYNRLVLTSLLQSGIFRSYFSFTDLIPIEDYAAVLNPIINNLEDSQDFSIFADKNLFLRNNWQDKDLVPQITEMGRSKTGNYYNQIRIGLDRYRAATQRFIDMGLTGNQLPIAVSPYLAKDMDMITVRRNDTSNFKESEIKQMKKKGDFSYKITVGYQRVVDANGDPLVIVTQVGDTMYEKYIYKPINLYGDGVFAQEYYDSTQPSVIDNGSLKVKDELMDSTIFNAFGKEYNNIIDNLSKEGIIKKDC